MKNRRVPVQKKGPNWYDFYDDWDLIESSIAQQYGIRLRNEINTISWSEVRMLISGLLPDTPLGKIIQIRSENSPDNLKNFTPEEKKIRNEYRRKMAKQKSQKEVQTAIENFKQAFVRLSDENAKMR